MEKREQTVDDWHTDDDESDGNFHGEYDNDDVSSDGDHGESTNKYGPLESFPFFLVSLSTMENWGTTAFLCATSVRRKSG